MVLKGSPIILRTILNSCGNAPITGRTFCATGLYFFPKMATGGTSMFSDRGGPRDSSAINCVNALHEQASLGVR
jgi:hypothetical protein